MWKMYLTALKCRSPIRLLHYKLILFTWYELAYPFIIYYIHFGNLFNVTNIYAINIKFIYVNIVFVSCIFNRFSLS